MANLLSVPQQTQILNLHQKGLSQRRIAQEVGINRSSVSRYIRRLSKCTTISNTGTLVGRHSACLGFEAAIREKWTLGLSIQRVYPELRS